ncbi:hypothetical protein [Streptomyces sp. SLBN-8D4]|uniref:hypothetical protein n=1 Tax=Streptomyces sp. SLBN-8D4 TaxID=3377728 RepID=UPI003C7BC55E
MTRSFDDDTPRRIRDADDLVQARRRDAGERIHVATISLVIDEQEKRARRRWLDRIRRAGWAVSWLSVPGQFVVVGDPVCGSLFLLSVPALVGARFAGRGLPTLQRAEAQPTRYYSWLGGKQRSGETVTRGTLMGMRLHDPTTGRFLSVDPVHGGNANPDEYCNSDPLKCYDLGGRFGWGKRIDRVRTGPAKAGMLGCAACSAISAGSSVARGAYKVYHGDRSEWMDVAQGATFGAGKGFRYFGRLSKSRRMARFARGARGRGRYNKPPSPLHAARGQHRQMVRRSLYGPRAPRGIPLLPTARMAAMAAVNTSCGGVLRAFETRLTTWMFLVSERGDRQEAAIAFAADQAVAALLELQPGRIQRKAENGLWCPASDVLAFRSWLWFVVAALLVIGALLLVRTLIWIRRWLSESAVLMLTLGMWALWMTVLVL